MPLENIAKTAANGVSKGYRCAHFGDSVHTMTEHRSRVVTYLEPELAEELGEIAAALDQSRSSLIAEALENALPVLRVLGDMGTALKRGPERHKEILQELAQAFVPIVQEVEQQVESMGGVWPPTSNRGVRK